MNRLLAHRKPLFISEAVSEDQSIFQPEISDTSERLILVTITVSKSAVPKGAAHETKTQALRLF
ncbi:hypothetical protein [Nodularia spumigena]|uniref:Uncharacterized protein n=1 Tax=Nodularia spumigena UHCC 0060 TaxID=3110300 RepID=A0ABU5UP21_NODSP|nr:hypothetical protein [Nodularia spumigena]AHJ30302.1 hypothetical protein NSP_40010 [Nodularia spumigena CCY9414]MEA5607524.1 hypothetical protein [Nodularia spumigena UHCC 0060]